MAVDYVSYSGKSNVGFNMKTNEDYILFNESDFGDCLFTSIADGSGAKNGTFRPSSIAVHQTETFLKRLYNKNTQLLLDNSKLFMEQAFLSANDVLIGFKLGHAGNTRLYIIRDQKVLQLTKDHTEGQKLVDSGVISEESYYTAIERLMLYNGIGISATPIVQVGQIQLKKNDVIVMTTDGIHYAYRKEAFFDILMNTQTMDEAAEQMVETALQLKVYPDNISVNVIWYHGSE